MYMYIEFIRLLPILFPDNESFTSWSWHWRARQSGSNFTGVKAISGNSTLANCVLDWRTSRICLWISMKRKKTNVNGEKTYPNSPGVKVVHMAWYLSPRSCKPFCSVPRAGVGPSSLPRRRLARCSTVRRWFDRPETAMRLQRSREKAQASDHTRNNNEMWPGKDGKSTLLNLHGPWHLIHRHLAHDVRTAILGDNFKVSPFNRANNRWKFYSLSI